MKTNTESTAAHSVDVPRLVLHLRFVLEYAERQTCTHEETYRGGAIWEICYICGKKWADDEGGKPDDAHDLPQVLTDARDFLNSLQAHSSSIDAEIEALRKALRVDCPTPDPIIPDEAAEGEFRRGESVAVSFTEGSEDENWQGVGEFMRYIAQDEAGFSYLTEPHAMVRTSPCDAGSVFPVRCIQRAS